jgi:hypothetical protein
MPDGGTNGYMTNDIYNPIYAGDDDDVDRVDGGSENTADPGDTAHVDTVDGGAAEDTYTDIETLVDDGTNDV